MVQEYKFLTPEQVDHFMTHGYIVIENAFTPEAAAEFTKDVWIRLGMDPDDRSTWNSDVGDRIHMARHKTVLAKTFAPKAWGAICELVGGEDKIDPATHYWSDEFIVNLGKKDYADMTPIEPRHLDNWHVDGDFFVHHLDSPEQALLVIPLFSDIQHRGGATYISPEGLEHVARYLAAHPEGCHPTGQSFTPSTGLDDPAQRYSFLDLARTKLTHFVELTGRLGDVILLHPLMLHSASKNYIQAHRIITNPPVSLKRDQPFQLARADPSEYSLVEKKTLKALGVDRWERDDPAAVERKRLVPKRVGRQAILYGLEKKRLEAHYNMPLAA